MTSPLIKICETPTSETQILESECPTYPFQKHPSRKPTIFGLWRCSTDIQDQEIQGIAFKQKQEQPEYMETILPAHQILIELNLFCDDIKFNSICI